MRSARASHFFTRLCLASHAKPKAKGLQVNAMIKCLCLCAWIQSKRVACEGRAADTPQASDSDVTLNALRFQPDQQLLYSHALASRGRGRCRPPLIYNQFL